MFKKLKEIFSPEGKKIKSTKPITIEEYFESLEELPHDVVDEEKIVIKACSIYNEKDGVDAILYAESGHIVIAKIPNLEKDVDEEFIEVIKKIRDEVSKFGGKLILLGEEHLLITPKNVIIEKVIKESREKKGEEK
ncbi:hypothetical protein J422_04745 [Methanocaldococcus villosus KIN24-T80]|uniref:DUF552 domain-containing protein n=1 Tax=Methanocaldococcus villosus KIN24-T80 TaxID=1069083 RepID=N6VQ62_9EURY|nr:cell division protein SepF [Methanocaldococcus villosus]ENN96020.1 hypothetical protein J422_04745 [Methanocaldococcus villosus KIN24-T80]